MLGLTNHYKINCTETSETEKSNHAITWQRGRKTTLITMTGMYVQQNQDFESTIPYIYTGIPYLYSDLDAPILIFDLKLCTIKLVNKIFAYMYVLQSVDRTNKWFLFPSIKQEPS